MYKAWEAMRYRIVRVEAEGCEKDCIANVTFVQVPSEALFTRLHPFILRKIRRFARMPRAGVRNGTSQAKIVNDIYASAWVPVLLTVSECHGKSLGRHKNAP